MVKTEQTIESESCSVMSNSLWPHGLHSPWNSPGQNTRVGSVQFSCSVVSDSLQPHELQHARPPCPSSTPEVHPNSCPLSWWCHPTTHPPSSLSPPSLNLSKHQGLFKWVSSSNQVAKVLEFQLQHQSFQWTFRTDFLSLLYAPICIPIAPCIYSFMVATLPLSLHFIKLPFFKFFLYPSIDY